MKSYKELTPQNAAQLLIEVKKPITGLVFYNSKEDCPKDHTFIGVLFSDTEWPFITTGGSYKFCARVIKEAALAKGHNPLKLTEAAVGEGFRLLSLEEIRSRENIREAESTIWRYTHTQLWENFHFGNNITCTYRTTQPENHWLIPAKKLWTFETAPRQIFIAKVGGAEHFFVINYSNGGISYINHPSNNTCLFLSWSDLAKDYLWSSGNKSWSACHD